MKRPCGSVRDSPHPSGKPHHYGKPNPFSAGANANECSGEYEDKEGRGWQEEAQEDKDPEGLTKTFWNQPAPRPITVAQKRVLAILAKHLELENREISALLQTRYNRRKVKDLLYREAASLIADLGRRARARLEEQRTQGEKETNPSSAAVQSPADSPED